MSAKKPTKPRSTGTTPKKKPTSSPAQGSPAPAIVDNFPGLSVRSKPQRPIRTGFMYDEGLLPYFSLHDEHYLDNPNRVTTCYDKCRTLGLVKRCIRLKITPCTDEDILAIHDADYLEKMKSTASLTDEELISMSHGYHDVSFHKITPCGDEDILTVHDVDYLEKMKSTASLTDEELIRMDHGYDGVSFHKNSMECARLSAGATIEMMKAIVSDKVTNGIAVVRPPGHHASKDEASGLCYFNNVAIAAKYCLDNLGLDRILILDWDVHHGQGTQRTFYDDPRVLYISIHRYEHGWFWPNLRESDFDCIGDGEGHGYNVNIPLNKVGMTDSDYLAIFHQLIMPIAMEYNPSAVIVSAGFDCALGCPEGEMKVIPPLFSHLVHMLRGLADGRLALILEGGYHLESLSESVAYSVRGLLDDNCPQISPTGTITPELLNVILNCINVLRPYWKCFQYQSTDYPEKAINLESSDPRGPADLVTESAAYYEIYKETPQPEDVKAQFTQQVIDIVKDHPTRTTRHRSCYVYDHTMLKHKKPLDSSHPERPRRISSIHDMLAEYGLLGRSLKLPSRLATKEELNTVHSMKHINEMKAIESTKPKDFIDLEYKYNSIYFHTETYNCALMAAGSVLNLVDSVMTNESRNGFAIVRPPGHHAEQHTACGFCFFNNVPVAAKYAQQKYNAKRVAIIDWDVHHGNGIQHMFESDDSVLYISLHRYDNGTFFPGSPDADFDKVGKGKGAGFNVNIPFNSKYSRRPGDPEYIAAFQQIIMPICYEFAPDLVFISAGFDAAEGDMLGGYSVTPGGYAHMTHMLSSLANGRLILVLEGGYNLNSISESFSSCVDVMLGGVPPRIPDTLPTDTAVESIRSVISAHKKYWKSLCCDVVLPYIPEEIQIMEAEKECDVMDQLAKKMEQAKTTASGSRTPSKPQTGSTPKPAVQPSSEVSAESNKTPQTGSSSKPAVQPSSEVSAENNKPSDQTPSTTREETEGAAAASDSSAAAQLPTELFSVVPLSWCAHLEDISPLAEPLDTSAPCLDCGNRQENWVCLTCYKVYCSRFVHEHMLFHSIATEHKMVLSYSDLSVWCYACDSYVHHEDLFPMKNSAHIHKFGSPVEG